VFDQINVLPTKDNPFLEIALKTIFLDVLVQLWSLYPQPIHHNILICNTDTNTDTNTDYVYEEFIVLLTLHISYNPSFARVLFSPVILKLMLREQMKHGSYYFTLK